jgi:plasmid stabilization system protein ParE
MSKYLIAPAAAADLDEIWDYYALELRDPDLADRIRDELFATFQKLAKTPGLGLPAQ